MISDGVGIGAVVSELKSAISSVVIWVGTGTRTGGGMGVDTGAMGAAESKVAGVVAVTGWTLDWVRTGVCRIVP